MRVLLIEDDIGYVNGLIPEMSRQYVVDIAYNSTDGEYLSEVNDYDMLVVDSDFCVKDSNTDVLTIKNKLINKDIPVVLLSENYAYEDVLKYMEKGADLCVPKNADPSEICQGMQIILKRSKKVVSDIINHGLLAINIKDKSLSINNTPVPLRRKEYDLLEYLILNKGRVVSKEALLEHMWATGIYIMSNTVEVHIKHLRDKIEKPYGIKIIHTVRGFGYKITEI